MFTELFDRYTKECLKEIEDILNMDMKLVVRLTYDADNNKINVYYNDTNSSFEFSFEKPALVLTDTLQRTEWIKGATDADKEPKTRKFFGVYNCSQNSISINVRSIEKKACEYHEDPENLIKVIYCHEMFHAIHHNLTIEKSGEEYWKDNRANPIARDIIEALASVVMARACQHLDIDGRRLIFDRLVKGENSSSIRLKTAELVMDVLNDDKYVFEKTAHILKKSLHSWNAAAAFLEWIK